MWIRIENELLNLNEILCFWVKGEQLHMRFKHDADSVFCINCSTNGRAMEYLNLLQSKLMMV